MSTGQYNATQPTITSGANAELQLTQRGSLKVALSDGGTNDVTASSVSTDAQSIATVGMNVNSRGLIFNGASEDKLSKPNVVSRLASSAATNNATSAKATAGNLHDIVGVNTNAAARFLKFYNKASAPNPAADTVFWSLYLPPSTVNGGMFTVDFGGSPLYFSTGIAWALVTGSGDTDNTAVGAGDILALNIAIS